MPKKKNEYTGPLKEGVFVNTKYDSGTIEHIYSNKKAVLIDFGKKGLCPVGVDDLINPEDSGNV